MPRVALPVTTGRLWEVVFELSPNGSNWDNHVGSSDRDSTKTIGWNILVSVTDAKCEAVDIDKAYSMSEVKSCDCSLAEMIRPCNSSTSLDTVHGVDKWGEFVINSVATLGDDKAYAAAIFDEG